MKLRRQWALDVAEQTMQLRDISTQSPELFRPASKANETGVGPPPWPAWVVKVSGHPARLLAARKKFGSHLLTPTDELLRWEARTNRRYGLERAAPT